MTKLFSAFLFVLTVALASSAMAASSDWVETPESSTRLVTAVSATGTLAAVPAGIEIELQPGWKTYWRSPSPPATELGVTCPEKNTRRLP